MGLKRTFKEGFLGEVSLSRVFLKGKSKYKATTMWSSLAHLSKWKAFGMVCHGEVYGQRCNLHLSRNKITKVLECHAKELVPYSEGPDKRSLSILLFIILSPHSSYVLFTTPKKYIFWLFSFPILCFPSGASHWLNLKGSKRTRSFGWWSL